MKASSEDEMRVSLSRSVFAGHPLQVSAFATPGALALGAALVGGRTVAGRRVGPRVGTRREQGHTALSEGTLLRAGGGEAAVASRVLVADRPGSTLGVGQTGVPHTGELSDAL